MADFSVPMSGAFATDERETASFAATGVLLASLLAAAGVIHLVMVPSHMAEWRTEGIGFAVAGWLQLGLATAIAMRPRRWVTFASVALNVGLIALWIVSRTSGFPFGPHANHAESVSFIDGATVGMQVVAILAAMASVTFPSVTGAGIAHRGMAALLPLAVVAMTTAVLVSPSARSHAGDAHGTHSEAAAVVAGGSASALVGGQPAAAAPVVDDGHGHAHSADPVAPAAAVVASAATDQAAGVAPAAHAVAATDPEAATHDHGADPAAAGAVGADDKGLSTVMNGHQHDAAPLPMDGMTTALLAHQLARTAELVAMYPTVADAEAAGYRRQGPFAPGLGTHYGKGGETIVGESINEENVLKPMLIYDGWEPTSKIAGFMYIAFGTKGIPEGFAGPNDIWHYHTNVCVVMRPDGSTDAPLGADRENVSKELCDKYGGFLIDNTGYMMHLWTVPGYESSKGVFHEVNPALPCPDGTFYSVPLDEIGDALTTCRS